MYLNVASDPSPPMCTLKQFARLFTFVFFFIFSKMLKMYLKVAIDLSSPLCSFRLFMRSYNYDSLTLRT